MPSIFPISSIPLSSLPTPPVVAAAAPNLGWFAPLSIAVSLSLVAPAGAAVYPSQPAVVDNTVTIDKWQQPLSGVSKVRPLPTQPNYAFLDTQFTQNTVDISRWQQPLGRASRARPVEYTRPEWPATAAEVVTEFVSFSVTVGQVLTRTLYYSSREYRAPVAAPAAPVTLRTEWDWYQPLGAMPPPNRAHEGIVVNWRSQVQENNSRQSWDWYYPLAGMPPPNQPHKGWLWLAYPFLSTQFTQNTQDISRWLQPLSRAVPIPRAPEGIVVNWRHRASVANFREAWDWYHPLASIPPPSRPREGIVVNWRIVAQVNTRTEWDWYLALAVMPPPNQPQAGWVWFYQGTAQPSNYRTQWDWYQPLAKMPPTPLPQEGWLWFYQGTVQVAPPPEPEPPEPPPEYDYPVGRQLDSDYGIRKSRLRRGRYVIGRR